MNETSWAETLSGIIGIILLIVIFFLVEYTLYNYLAPVFHFPVLSKKQFFALLFFVNLLFVRYKK